MRSLRKSVDEVWPSSVTRRVVALGLPALLALALLPVMSGGSLSADDPVTLNGDWAPFTRCPVDDPVMLAVQGPAQTAYCVAVNTPGGSIKLGNSTATTGESGVQFGIAGPSGGTKFPVISPAGGAIVGAPVNVPGGLLGLMCPSTDLTVALVCGTITNNDLNTVTATVQQAGPASDFNLAAGLAAGIPVLTLPIKVKLDNPLLGVNCYIGSEAEPILLRPANATSPVLYIERFAADGTPNPTGPLQLLKASGLTQSDNTFAVPGATGCGLAGVLDSAINLKQGLPSPSGNNSLVLNDVSTYTARLYPPPPNAGQLLSDDWHSAICTDTCLPTPTAPPAASPTPVPATLPYFSLQITLILF